MKKVLSPLLLAICLTAGCKTVAAPPVPPAPGYLNSDDQKLGQTLAAFNGFVIQEKANYAKLSPAQQAQEKTALNSLIDAVDVANTVYTAYHQGTQTLQQAQDAAAKAQTAENNLATVKGAK